MQTISGIFISHCNLYAGLDLMLKTLISIKSEYDNINIILAIILNMVLVYFVLKSSEKIQKYLGIQGINILRKVFGIILLAIGVKLFTTNIKLIFA